MRGKSKLKRSRKNPHEKIALEIKQANKAINKEQSEMSLKELRIEFPHITARSKKEFLTELNQSNVQD